MLPAVAALAYGAAFNCSGQGQPLIAVARSAKVRGFPSQCLDFPLSQGGERRLLPWGAGTLAGECDPDQPNPGRWLRSAGDQRVRAVDDFG